MVNNILKRLFKNASVTFGGSFISALMGLVCISITARALGAELLGVFAMIQAFVIIIDSLINFQCWQAVVKFGSDFIKQNKKEEFASLTKFCIILDASTAIVGTVIAAMAIYLFGHYKGLSEQTIIAATTYSLWILFNLKGSPIGLLRLSDNFKFIASTKIIAMSVKLILVIIAYFIGGKLITFILIWPISILVESSLYMLGGLREANKIYGQSIFKAKLATIIKDKTIWKFVICTNLHQSIRLASREMDVLIVGAVLTTAAAGIYKVARQFAFSMAQLTEPVYEAIYPELAKLASEKHFAQMKHIMKKASAAIGSISLLMWITFIVIGKWFLTTAVGSEYTQSYPVMILLMGALTIWSFAFTLPAGLLTTGRADNNLYVQIISFAVFLPALYLFLKNFNLIGAGFAQIVFYICYAVGSMFFFVKNISKEQS